MQHGWVSCTAIEELTKGDHDPPRKSHKFCWRNETAACCHSRCSKNLLQCPQVCQQGPSPSMSLLVSPATTAELLQQHG
jgi:hypothetical protein